MTVVLTLYTFCNIRCASFLGGNGIDLADAMLIWGGDKMFWLKIISEQTVPYIFSNVNVFLFILE